MMHVLEASAIEKIHAASLKVLATTGMIFESEKALEIFRRHGFRVEGKTVYFKEKDIEEALRTVGRSFTLLARNPKHTLDIALDTVVVGMGRGAVFVVDEKTVRPATCDDYIEAAKLAQSLEVIQHWGPLWYPNDISSQNLHLFMTATMIKLLDKPYNVFDSRSLDMISIAFGVSRGQMKADAAKGVAYGQTTINPSSPLRLIEEECNNLIELAGAGVPIIVAPQPAAGTTAPCTLAGVLVLQNSEILATLVLTQLVYPGVPVLYGIIAANSDMRALAVAYASPEMRILEAASAQLARFYGLLSRSEVGLTDACAPDFQAGAEALFRAFNAFSCGINFLTGSGLLGSYLGASLDKVVLDCELVGYVRRYLEGFEVSEETLAVDVIEEVGPCGQFLTHEHTFKYCRSEFYNPCVFQRVSYEKWTSDGRMEARENARKIVNQLLQEYQQPELDPAVVRDLDAYVAKHET